MNKQLPIISRREAIERGLKKYYTAKACPKQHVCERATSNGNCIDCMNVYKKVQGPRYYQENKDEIKAGVKRYRQANREAVNRRSRRYCAERHAMKLQRCPIWADKIKIQEFYDRASQLSIATGVEHEVDHIIPLKGKFVSGLHVETNLQILTMSANRSKNNKFEIE